jgi:hypothetical protein
VKRLKQDWPLGIKPTPDQLEWFHRWGSDVDRAMASNDSLLLAKLYEDLTLEFDVQQASQLWLNKMSGWDASAITG